MKHSIARLSRSLSVAGCMAVLASLVAAGCASAGPGAGQDEAGPIESASDASFVSAAQESAEEGDKVLICVGEGDEGRGYVGYVTLANGLWGNWASCFSFCPNGTFATGISLDSTSPRGGGVSGGNDDVALNQVTLSCQGGATITSGTQQFFGGGIPDFPLCANYGVLKGGRLQFEASQGSGDDTAANNVNGLCSDNTGVFPHPKTNWGTMGSWVSCPQDTYVCGIKTRIEPNQGGGDDTSLNGVRFACCAY